MGDHVKPHKNLDNSWTDVDDSSETEKSSDTEDSINSSGFKGSCEMLHCHSPDLHVQRKSFIIRHRDPQSSLEDGGLGIQSSLIVLQLPAEIPRNLLLDPPLLIEGISEANSEIIDFIVKEYWKELNGGEDVKRSHNSHLNDIDKKTALFIGDKAEKHAALHKLCTRLAECYYMELRIELEDRCKKHCSSKDLNELKGFSDIIVAAEFEEVGFNCIESTAIWLEERGYLQETVQRTFYERISSLTNADETWLEKAAKQQYEYFEMFVLMASEDDGCNWIELKIGDDRLMEIIGYTIYKKIQDLDKYSDEELNKIKPIYDQICSQSDIDIVKLSCIFIIYQSGSDDIIEPVFRVKNSQQVLFVDMNQRVYTDWDDFEANNKLPECLYCGPFQGEYNKKRGFRVNFSWSPASYTSKKVINVLDVVGKVVTVGSAAALGAAAALHTLPMIAVGGTVAAVASGAYGINRGIGKILDKVNHVQSVHTQDVVNVLSNMLSVASGGVAEVLPALAAAGSGMLFTQSAVQGLTAITTLVPEYENNNNISLQSGEMPMKTLLFFNSKSPEEAIEKIKETYDLAPDKSAIFVIKSFVVANSVPSVDEGRVQKYFSKNLTSLVLNLLDAIEGGIKTNFMDVLFLRDVFSYGHFTSLDLAFTNATKREKTEFFRLLLGTVCMISSYCVSSVPLRGYRGVEFHPVSEVFEQIDFGIIAKQSYSIDKYLDSVTRKKLETNVLKILTIIYCEDGNRAKCSLSEYSNLIKSKLPEILNAFEQGRRLGGVKLNKD